MARYVQQGDHLDITFAGTFAGGALKLIAGRPGIIDPKPDGEDWVSGEVGSITIQGVVDVDKGAVAFDDGDIVGYDIATDAAVAAGAGDFDCGWAVGDHLVGAATVRVLLGT